MSKSTIPYAAATSGAAAREEITRILRNLRRFGCESVGFMDDFADKSALLIVEQRRNPSRRGQASALEDALYRKMCRSGLSRTFGRLKQSERCPMNEERPACTFINCL